MKDGFGNRFVDIIINRLRFLFSIEFVFSLAATYFLRKVPIINNWISPPYTPDFTTGTDNVVKQFTQHNNWEYLRFMFVILLVMAITYGIGEIIRRRMKLKSLFSKGI